MFLKCEKRWGKNSGHGLTAAGRTRIRPPLRMSLPLHLDRICTSKGHQVPAHAHSPHSMGCPQSLWLRIPVLTADRDMATMPCRSMSIYTLGPGACLPAYNTDTPCSKLSLSPSHSSFHTTCALLRLCPASLPIKHSATPRLPCTDSVASCLRDWATYLPVFCLYIRL